MKLTGLITVLSITAGSFAATVADRAEDVVPFTGAVNQPDVMGGYASTNVVVRLREGVEPGLTRGGDLTFAHARADADAVRASVQLAAALNEWEAASIDRTSRVEPANRELARQFGLDRYYTIEVPRGTDTRAMANQLAAFDSLIETAEVDGIGGVLQTFPNDQHFNLQYALHNTGQTINGQVGIADADLDAPEAWDLHTGTDDVVLALIDSGLSYSHPDLNDKRIAGFNAIDGSSNVDDSWLISHGTHCGGIAAAESNNGIGVAGVSWGALIMPIKVVNLIGSGTETDCANGVIWAADNGAHVGSMSLGYPEGISYFENAINYAHAAGMVLVAASGNTPGAAIFPPARWDNVMAVGATDNRDDLASFTTTGPEMSVSAPGVSVYSCWDALFSTDTYDYLDGTSMACPHVAGLACVLRSANPMLTNDEVRAIIEDTADDLGTPGWDPSFGHGRINTFAAVQAALGDELPGDINGDGFVDVDDLLLLLGDWGPCPGCPTDVDGNDVVDVNDLLAMLENWTG
jgi:subtilisin family serine protease